MRLIDADSLYKIIEKDKCELNNHKDGRSRSVHNGEYSHFLKRIAEQSEIHLSVQLCLPNGQMVKNVELNDSKCRFHLGRSKYDNQCVSGLWEDICI